MGGMSAARRYLPAASFDFLLPVYDPIMKLLRYRGALAPLVAQAQLQPGFRVLDIGCGTGTLVVMIRQAHPGVDVTGIDPDPKALARAARKAARAGVAIRLQRGFADALPYAGGRFDRVFSSMMFHHVPRPEKPGVLAEVCRVLAPGGRLEFVDFDDPALLDLMRGAGLAEARRSGTYPTLPRRIVYYQARRPAPTRPGEGAAS